MKSEQKTSITPLDRKWEVYRKAVEAHDAAKAQQHEAFLAMKEIQDAMTAKWLAEYPSAFVNDLWKVMQAAEKAIRGDDRPIA